MRCARYKIERGRDVCNESASMRWVLISVFLLLITAVAQNAEAQRISLSGSVAPVPGTPVVSVAWSVTDMNSTDDVIAASKRFSDDVFARLRPLETRLQNDARLRSAGTIVGLGAAAVGALRGQRTLTFVGTEAIRLGLDRQLNVVRARTGFSVTPSLGHRTFSVMFSRSF